MQIEKYAQAIRITREINNIHGEKLGKITCSPAILIKTITYLANQILFATLKHVSLTLELIPARMQEKNLTEHQVSILLSERPQP